MTKVALYLLYVLAAVGAGCEVALYSNMLGGIGAALLVFLVCFQVHSALIHRRDKRRYEGQIQALHRVGIELENALQATHAKIADVVETVEARASAQNRKLVSELHVLESLMRDQASKLAAAKAQAVSTSGAKPFQPLNDADMLEAVRDSLVENRVDILLQPIVQLPQRKVRFYEAYSRLRAMDGRVILPKQYLPVAGPAGLMCVIDNLFLFRCVQMVRRLMKKNRDIAVFCNISTDTLNDPEFFPQFLEYAEQNRDLAPHIVFECAQNAVLKSTSDALDNLRYLARLGFGLSMDHVENLSCNYRFIREIGFRYFKVRAALLTEERGAAMLDVAAEDFKTLLARHELELVVEWVEDEKMVLQILDCGVDYAEGYLFGEPRAVRDDFLSPKAAGRDATTKARASARPAAQTAKPAVPTPANQPAVPRKTAAALAALMAAQQDKDNAVDADNRKDAQARVIPLRKVV